MSTELLSRIQFAFTISFHILYPAFSIGLVTFIAIFEAIWLKTKNLAYLNICKFWTKILALTFGMGIVSGIVMEFQLGTNWSNFTALAGNVLGVLFTYEVLTAFFIEAGFLGVMFFGWNRVSPGFHFVATLLALTGVTVSAFWIMSANSWMQSPAGVQVTGDHYNVINWFQVIFNPTFLPRFFHMVIATYIATLFVVMAISAYYILHERFLYFAKICLVFSLFSLAILIPLQLFIGDQVGRKIHQYQPLKTAAIEGIWETQKGAPFLIFAWPNQTQETNQLAIGIPKLAALVNTHHLEGRMQGLKSTTPENRPYVPLVFFSFRLMFGLWGLMVLVVISGLILYFKKRLGIAKRYLTMLMFTAPIGFLAIITGWFTAEFGRQPWVIYNLLKTAAASSPNVTPFHLVVSLSSIIFVYGIIFGYFYFRYFFKIISNGPDESVKHHDETFYYLLPELGKSPPNR